jgi:hypothetical protein
MTLPITYTDFVTNYPEFVDVGAIKFELVSKIADAIGGGWVGLCPDHVDTVQGLLIAHILTLALDGAAPIESYKTKESAITYNNKFRESENELYNFKLSDYGVLLKMLIDIQYFGVS